MGSAGTVIGRYTVHDAIGAGGMATVHLGRMRGDASFARPVAVKRLQPRYAADPTFVTMFLDETRLAARIAHPNVVPVLDVVSTGAELFMVMEYVAGEPLSALTARAAAREEPIPVAVCVAIVCDVLHGLHAAHEAKDTSGAPLGIVHRDVSPQNVLVGADGLSRLLDFGVAKARGQLHTTGEGELKGKLRYMAPEQLADAPLTRAADVYAAGVVLWELLAGRRLFGAESDAEVVGRILVGGVPAPSAAAREGGARSAEDAALVARLDAAVLGALAPEPSARFASAREMARALEAQVPRAPLVDVAAWVERTAGDALRARAELVLRMERGEDGATAPARGDEPTLVPASAHAASDASPPARGRAMLAGALALAALAGALALTALFATRAPSAASRAPTAGSAPARVDAPAARAPTATGPDAPTAPAAPTGPTAPTATAPTAPAASAAQAAPSAAPRAPAAATRRRADPCKPPFTWDAQGVKHFKAECM